MKFLQGKSQILLKSFSKSFTKSDYS